MKKTKEISEQIEDLEERISDLEDNQKSQGNINWTVILILGFWIIAAVFVTVSPVGKEHFEEIFGAAVGLRLSSYSFLIDQQIQSTPTTEVDQSYITENDIRFYFCGD
jgi:hypothetical protein